MPPFAYTFVTLLGQVVRRSRFWDVIPISALLVLTCNATEVPDNGSYREAYLFGSGAKYYRGFGYTFKALIQLCKVLGFNYGAFKLLVMFIILALTELVFLWFAKNTMLVWSYYLIFPGVLTYIQIRQTLALAFVGVGLAVLLRKGMRGIPVSIVLIAVACTIHSTCVVFLVFPLMFVLKERALVLCAGICAVAGLLATNIMPRIALHFFSAKKVAAYMGADIPGVERLGIAYVVLANVLIVLYVRSRVAEARQRWGRDLELISGQDGAPVLWQRDFAALDGTYRLAITLVALLPLLLFNSDFLRFDRAVVIFVYIVAANYFTVCMSSRCLELHPRYNRALLEKTAMFLFVTSLFVFLIYRAIRLLIPEVFGV